MQKPFRRTVYLLLAIIFLGGALLPLRPGAASFIGQQTSPTPAAPGGTAASSTELLINPGGLSPLYTGCGGVTPPAAVNAAYEQQVLDLVNEQRRINNLPPLKRVSLLDDASRYHALDLLQDDYFEHDSYDRVGGNLQFACAWSARISSYYTNSNYLAENIAAGYTTPQSVMDGWMNSPGHRANILRSEVWEIGIGYYLYGGTYGYYWAQDFGRRNGIYPLIINRDAASTTNKTVSIYIYGSFTQMRLKNDPGTFGSWQTFQNAFSWEIPCNAGSHTVTAELKTSGGAVYTSSDTISYTGSSCQPTLGGLPDSLSFTYSTSQDSVSPPWINVTPTNISTSDTLSWTAAPSGNWVSVSPASGSTPNSFSIIPINLPSATPDPLDKVTVTVSSPGGTVGSPKLIYLDLTIINGPIYIVYLPNVGR